MVNSEIHHIVTWHHANFHHHSMNFNKYLMGVYYLGFKVFNMLPSYINIESDNPKKFKLILQTFYIKIPFIL